jgi:hypothetical protein
MASFCYNQYLFASLKLSILVHLEARLPSERFLSIKIHQCCSCYDHISEQNCKRIRLWLLDVGFINPCSAHHDYMYSEISDVCPCPERHTSCTDYSYIFNVFQLPRAKLSNRILSNLIKSDSFPTGPPVESVVISNFLLQMCLMWDKNIIFPLRSYTYSKTEHRKEMITKVSVIALR